MNKIICKILGHKWMASRIGNWIGHMCTRCYKFETA